MICACFNSGGQCGKLTYALPTLFSQCTCQICFAAFPTVVREIFIQKVICVNHTSSAQIHTHFLDVLKVTSQRAQSPLAHWIAGSNRENNYDHKKLIAGCHAKLGIGWMQLSQNARPFCNITSLFNGAIWTFEGKDSLQNNGSTARKTILLSGQWHTTIVLSPNIVYQWLLSLASIHVLLGVLFIVRQGWPDEHHLHLCSWLCPESSQCD